MIIALAISFDTLTCCNFGYDRFSPEGTIVSEMQTQYSSEERIELVSMLLMWSFWAAL